MQARKSKAVGLVRCRSARSAVAVGATIVATLVALSVATSAAAQSAPPEPASTPAPPAAPAAPPRAAVTPAPNDPAAAKLDSVQITGSRPDDVQERRQSTAAKIIIGREEIERFGDSTLGDVLKRLPGVTMQGRPGRGGAIRMRGLGSGYTQILLDGERIPPGFSLDSLSPDQIERIEIIRAPTAETGARAIAGTINIITRGGYTKHVNDLRLTAGLENGRAQPALAWTRNDTLGSFIYNYSLTAFRQNRANDATTTTTDRDIATDAVLLDQRDQGTVRSHGQGLHATARLQWRLGEGENVVVSPMLIHSSGRSHRTGTVEQSVPAVPPSGCLATGIGAPTGACLYDHSVTDGTGSTELARLNGQWNRRLDERARFELHGALGATRNRSASARVEQTNGLVSRTLDDDVDSTNRTWSASGKLIAQAFGEHSVVSGLELEGSRRDDTHTTLQDGAPLFVDFGDNVSASELRIAGYAQDEWNVSPNWAAHAGLRWEGITTKGSGVVGVPDADNRSSVWSPLLHAVWKPDPKGRDQIRASFTKSYRSPTLGNLIARPSINSRYPVPGPNTATQPDRAGNPDLKPELATGVDIAFERYLPGSGLLSANVFQRRISNFMRSQTTLEAVPWSAVPRYVSRTRNIGSAVTEGVELEAKARLSDLVAGAPKVDLRSNASFFRSRVAQVPGPDNRLDQQPDYTANLGADYRFTGVPLTLGGNLNFTPGYVTRVSDMQTVKVSRKFIADAYALYVFSPTLQLRFTASNLNPLDYVTGGTFEDTTARETSVTTAPTYLNLQVRVEMKL